MKKQLIYLFLLTSNLSLSIYSSTNKEEPYRRMKSKTVCYLLIKNNLQVCNNICIGNNASIGGSLTVGRSSLFNGPVTINFPARRIAGADALTVNGNTDLNGNVTIRGDLIIEGDIIGTITNEDIPDGSITTSKLADGSVTEPKLANNSVSSRTIQNSVVTNAKLATATSANDPNTIVLRDGTGSFNAQNIEFVAGSANLNIAGTADTAMPGYKVIAGTINADGSIAQGTGDFNVDHTEDSGTYTINFTPSLVAIPITTTTSFNTILSAPTIQNATQSSINIFTYGMNPTLGSPEDQKFSFIALGIPS